MRVSIALLCAGLNAWAEAHGDHSHDHGPKVFSAAELAELEKKWGTDWGFSGISTFAHLPHQRCLTNPETPFDIGIIGAPFDTAVTYRPGTQIYKVPIVRYLASNVLQNYPSRFFSQPEK